MNPDEFFQNMYEQTVRDIKEAMDALENTPGNCRVDYAVFGKEHSARFDTLLEAFAWVDKREWAEEQATRQFLLYDGTILKATMATKGGYCLTKKQHKKFGTYFSGRLTYENFQKDVEALEE